MAIDHLQALADDLMPALPGADEQALALAVLVSSVLERLRCLPDAGRAAYAAAAAEELRQAAVGAEASQGIEMMANALVGLPKPGGSDRLLDAALAVAEPPERRGALRVSYALLARADALADRGSPLFRGKTLMRRSRIARLAGDMDVAMLHLEAARSLGEQEELPELLAHAALSEGNIARSRGNYPRARLCFGEAVEHATVAGNSRMLAHAHEGLMISASTAGDLGLALSHGWAAYRVAGDDPELLSEIMVNLSGVCSLAGLHRAALRGYLMASGRAVATRVRVPALAGAVISAAHLNALGIVLHLQMELWPFLQHAQMPFEAGEGAHALGKAFLLLGDEESARPYLREAADLARAHGYHELAHRVAKLERPAALTAPTPSLALSAVAEEIVRDLEELPLDAPAREMYALAFTSQD